MKPVKWIVGGIIVGLLCLFPFLAARAEAQVRVFVNGGVLSMDREAYLVGVVAAEMPAGYELEALKAQAVAARTRAARGGCLSHPEADVCGESACCQGYLDEAEQRTRWGRDYETFHSRVAEAVEATRGLILTYEGRPIEVLYHAVSGGHTEDVENVFAAALPYLRGVPSPGEENARDFETVDIFPKADLALVFPDAGLEGGGGLEILSRTESGRVTALRVGGAVMTGQAFRRALGLHSANFTLEDLGGSIRVTQRGYGHGVGMSQAGARAMARAGATFEEILLHYYTGVALAYQAN